MELFREGTVQIQRQKFMSMMTMINEMLMMCEALTAIRMSPSSALKMEIVCFSEASVSYLRGNAPSQPSTTSQ
jgi:hypothetical protein